MACKEKKKEPVKQESSEEYVQPPAHSTTVTSPENMVVVMHKAANYAKWKHAYDADNTKRLENGLHNYVIGRGLTDSNTIIVALRADNIDRAKAFFASQDLKNTMQKAGVTGPVTTHFLQATWQDTAYIGPLPRSMTTFSVKNPEAWSKSFDDGKLERIDNGILTRVISHDVADPKKIQLITALSDTAKAFAYYKSAMLKKRREAGTVQGEPRRFIFHITHRY